MTRSPNPASRPTHALDRQGIAMPLHFVTGNPNKVREVQQILGVEVRQVALHLPELQSLDVDEVIRFKAEQAYHQVGAPVLVEDSSLAFVAWNGLPGALIKWFMETVGSAGLCRMLCDETNRQAVARSSLDLYDGWQHQVFSGTVRGRIALAPRGQGGLGWDDIFIPEGHTRTFAEMTAEEKNRISMRSIALAKLRDFLTGATQASRLR